MYTFSCRINWSSHLKGRESVFLEYARRNTLACYLCTDMFLVGSMPVDLPYLEATEWCRQLWWIVNDASWVALEIWLHLASGRLLSLLLIASTWATNHWPNCHMTIDPRRVEMLVFVNQWRVTWIAGNKHMCGSDCLRLSAAVIIQRVISTEYETVACVMILGGFLQPESRRIIMWSRGVA